MKQYGKQGAAKQGPTNLGLSGKAGPGFRAVEGVKRAKRVGTVMAKKGLRAVAKNPGKAGLAMAGLAAAGGLGIAGAKAIGNARKPKSLTDKLKNASKKMFK